MLEQSKNNLHCYSTSLPSLSRLHLKSYSLEQVLTLRPLKKYVIYSMNGCIMNVILTHSIHHVD